jgi:transposase InsO family protein
MTLTKEYPVKRVCNVLCISRSSYYYQPKAADETALKDALKKAAGEFVTYGSRRLKEQLKREGWEVGRKRVKRLMRELDIQVKIKKPKIKTTDSNHDGRTSKNLVKGLEIVRPEQVWVADITYIHLALEVVYLAILMDVFTRIIRGWHLSRNIDQELTLTALRNALATGRAPEIHHSDQGRQYFADAYLDMLDDFNTQVSFADVGKPGQNAYAERVIRTIKEEEVYLNEYQDYQDAYLQIGRFIDEVYDKKRIHSSLGYLTPVEFEQKWINENQDGILLTKKTDFCVQI